MFTFSFLDVVIIMYSGQDVVITTSWTYKCQALDHMIVANDLITFTGQ